MKDKRLLKLFISVLLTLGALYLNNKFLDLSFSYNREAFQKGYGHLLIENNFNAVIYIISQYFISTSILSYGLFNYSNSETIKKAAAIIIGLSFLIIIFLILGFLIQNSLYKFKIKEILITIIYPVIGVNFALYLAKKIK